MIPPFAASPGLAESATAAAACVSALVAVLTFVDTLWRRRHDHRSAEAKRAHPRRPRRMLVGVLIGCFALTAGSALVYLLHDGKAVHTSTAAPLKPIADEERRVGPTPAQRKAERLKKRQASEERSLAHFIRVMMEQPVRCSPKDRIPAKVLAQQICHMGSATVVFTRLSTKKASRRFWYQRFLNSYPFKGYAGANCGYGPWSPGGSWHDGNGVDQGSWAFRSSGGKAVFIWEVRPHRVVVRATDAIRRVAHLCQIWYEHSGEVP
jgi:hypothetical protein